jgi:hypothetical protein
MFKWLKNKVMPPPAPQLSALGAEIMEAMQNPDEWQASEYVLRHKSGLEVWVANRDANHTFFRIHRLPTAVTNANVSASLAAEKRLEKMFNVHDKMVLAPVAYALQDTLYGTLESTTLNALRLARQTESINP